MAPRSFRGQKGKIFIGGISKDLEDNELKNMFEKFGEIIDWIVIRDKETKRSRGFGFVTFSSPKDATAAIKEMNTKEINGKPLHVMAAEARDGAGPSDRGGGSRGPPRGRGYRSNYREDYHPGNYDRLDRSPPRGWYEEERGYGYDRRREGGPSRDMPPRHDYGPPPASHFHGDEGPYHRERDFEGRGPPRRDFDDRAAPRRFDDREFGPPPRGFDEHDPPRGYERRDPPPHDIRGRGPQYDDQPSPGYEHHRAPPAYERSAPPRGFEERAGAPPASFDERSAPPPRGYEERGPPPSRGADERAGPRRHFDERSAPPQRSFDERAPPPSQGFDDRSRPPPQSYDERAAPPPRGYEERPPAGREFVGRGPPSGREYASRGPPSAGYEARTPARGEPQRYSGPEGAQQAYSTTPGRQGDAYTQQSYVQKAPVQRFESEGASRQTSYSSGPDYSTSQPREAYRSSSPQGYSAVSHSPYTDSSRPALQREFTSSAMGRDSGPPPSQRSYNTAPSYSPAARDSGPPPRGGLYSSPGSGSYTARGETYQSSTGGRGYQSGEDYGHGGYGGRSAESYGEYRRP